MFFNLDPVPWAPWVMAGMLGLVPLGCAAQTLRLEGDAWAPYVMDSGAGGKGYMVDIAESIFREAGYAVSFQVTPWTRALHDAETGDADGIVGIYFAQAREKAFVIPAEELGVSLNRFFVKSGSPWNYAGPGSLAGMVLGTISGYDYGELNPYIASQVQRKTGKVEEMHGNDALQANLKKLMQDRVTVLVDDQVVVHFVASALGLDTQIRPAGALDPGNKVGIAFSAKTPGAAEYARVLSAGIARLRKTGGLDPLLGRYGVADWKR